MKVRLTENMFADKDYDATLSMERRGARRRFFQRTCPGAKWISLNLTLLAIAVPVLFLIGVGEATAGEVDRINVFVSILPQKYFVERVGGDRVEVDVLVLPGQSPATYSPPPQQLTRLARAQVYFRIGVPFEKSLIPKIESAMKDLLIVDTRDGIPLRKIEGDHHHEEHNHHEGGMDPHIWLSPVLVKMQAEIIYETLLTIDPESKDEYKGNYDSFVKDLDELHERIKTALAPIKGRMLFVFHPSFGYFADAYGLRQVAVETGGKEPSARQVVRLIEMAKKEKVEVIFVQPQFSRKSAQTVAREINGAVVPLDPLAEDYLGNLEDIAIKVEEALR